MPVQLEGAGTPEYEGSMPVGRPRANAQGASPAVQNAAPVNLVAVAKTQQKPTAQVPRPTGDPRLAVPKAISEKTTMSWVSKAKKNIASVRIPWHSKTTAAKPEKEAAMSRPEGQARGSISQEVQDLTFKRSWNSEDWGKVAQNLDESYPDPKSDYAILVKPALNEFMRCTKALEEVNSDYHMPEPERTQQRSLLEKALSKAQESLRNAIKEFEDKGSYAQIESHLNQIQALEATRKILEGDNTLSPDEKNASMAEVDRKLKTAKKQMEIAGTLETLESHYMSPLTVIKSRLTPEPEIPNFAGILPSVLLHDSIGRKFIQSSAEGTHENDALVFLTLCELYTSLTVTEGKTIDEGDIKGICQLVREEAEKAKNNAMLKHQIPLLKDIINNLDKIDGLVKDHPAEAQALALKVLSDACIGTSSPFEANVESAMTDRCKAWFPKDVQEAPATPAMVAQDVQDLRTIVSQLVQTNILVTNFGGSLRPAGTEFKRLRPMHQQHLAELVRKSTPK